jgi:CheY-like chemotaxis protein
MKLILVADPDEVYRKGLKQCLTEWGLRVIEVADGKTALKVCQEGSPDLVIADLSLPGMSGAELAKTLKKTKSEIPVILISTNELTSPVPAAGFFQKPFIFAKLFRTMETILGTKL